jgi:hypothetical protein
MREQIKMTHAEWLAEAARRYGPDSLKWQFKCPSCGHVACVQDWKDAGAPEGAVAFSCIGRYTGDPAAAAAAAFKGKGGPCNYTCGGLFQISPLTITLESGEESPAFPFPDQEPEKQ